MGVIRLRGKIWWIRYYRNGRRQEETSGSSKRSEAERLLKLREGDVARGVPVTPKVGRMRFDEAAEDVLNDYQVNGKRSLPDIRCRINKHLKPIFGGRRMAAVTTADVRAFSVRRQKAGASNGEINRELTALKRMFSLAIQGGKLLVKPYIPMLKENNVRTGFFEPEQYAAVLRHLPADVQPVVTFAYITGWRITSEVCPLQWRQIDFGAGEIRLDPGTTKNSEGRVFPFTAELWTLLSEQRRGADELQRETGRICPWVFHRRGKQMKSFRVTWRAACEKAGCPGRIPHDLRRTAVRRLVRAGVPERVAMQLTGHKTRSVFERYNIVSGGDLRQAVQRIDLENESPGVLRGETLGVAQDALPAVGNL